MEGDCRLSQPHRYKEVRRPQDGHNKELVIMVCEFCGDSFDPFKKLADGKKE